VKNIKITRVHTHGSEIFYNFFKNYKTFEVESIIKSATTESGIHSILMEYKGTSWYNNFSENKIVCELEKISSQYQRIKISTNKGFFNLQRNISYKKLIKFIDLTIKHYIKIWQLHKGQEYAPLHGDLSLVGNVMFNQREEVLFVDWEQFNDKEKIPTGLDPIMTLLENIYYELMRSNKIDSQILQHVINKIIELKEADLISPILLESPAKTSLDFIKLNSYIWKNQYYKLPGLKLSDKVVKNIDDAISKSIN
tara:strand:- start:2304 stop:3062 length:759 start_codon:yes stop_codon:yes gene_type:complete